MTKCHRILSQNQICSFSGTEDMSYLRDCIENTLAAAKVLSQVCSKWSYALSIYCFH